MVGRFPVLQLTVVLVLLLAGATSSPAQARERHLDNPTIGELCRRSAFLHGYIHGYEEGFRRGDLDIHLGRGYRDPGGFPEFHSLAGFQPAFGSRRYFQMGYRAGFATAYQEARQGFSFSGWQQLKQAASGPAAGVAAPEFDEAVAAGYSQGLSARPDLDEGDAFRVASQQCRLVPGRDATYCDAFTRGFALACRSRYARRLSASALTSPPPAVQ